MMMQFFEIVTPPACGENCMCSFPRTGDATAEKSQKQIARNSTTKKPLNHRLFLKIVTKCSHHSALARQQFKKNASPSQAKNRSCSRGLILNIELSAGNKSYVTIKIEQLQSCHLVVQKR